MVEPVSPTRPIVSPAATSLPTETRISEAFAYSV